MVYESNTKDERLMKNSVLFKKLLKYMHGYEWNYVLALILTGIRIGLDLLVPYILGLVLKMLGADEIDIKKILIYCGIMLVTVLAMRIVSYINVIILQYTGNKIVKKIRKEVLLHIQTLSHAQFNAIPIGKLVTRVTSDVNVLFTLFTNVLINIISSIATVIGVFVAMFMINSFLASILLCVVPVLLALSLVFRYFSRRAHRKVRENVANMNAFLSENISGMKITQVFHEEEKNYQEFSKNNQKLRRSLINELFVFGIFRPSIFVLYITSVILVLWFGGNQAININLGVTEVGIDYATLYVFYNFVHHFFNPIQQLADQYNELQSSFASAEKIFTILNMKTDIEDEPDAIDMEIKGDIEFKDVWFSYIPDEWILKGVSMHIHANDTVAFVGATGSGKTTMLNLIVRNYDIQKGQVLIDGVDIKKIKLSSLRSQIGEMLQDVFLFSGTVESNISMNDPNISHEEVVEASTYVNASKFIDKLENKYEEEVRERGNNFSQGQRQLISFARTIVHKPKVMVLDEATSNIDTETEVLIQDSLKKIMDLGTVIVVAHRLSTIQHANKIYVFSEGKIIEEGNHQELLSLHGRYYKLYLLQFNENDSNQKK